MEMIFVTTIVSGQPIGEVEKVIAQVLTEAQKHNVIVDIVIWCVQCELSCTANLKKICPNIRIVSSNHEPLSKVSSLLNKLPVSSSKCMVVFLSFKQVFVHGNLIELLLAKMEEHDIRKESDILTASGLKIFPHSRCTSSKLIEGVHWKRYGEIFTDREVHIFSSEFCLIPLQVLVDVSKLQDDNPIHDNCIWLSFLMSYKMNPCVRIWKMKSSNVLTLSADSVVRDIESLVDESAFHTLYSKMYDLDWPKGVSEPIADGQHLSTKSCSSFWNDGFCGVNMQIHPASELDLEAAAAYGVKVIRVGAVADAKDLTYLLDPKSESAEQDESHLHKVLPRFRAALSRADSLGLKIIITMVDLPGCNFHSGSCRVFWESSQCRERIVKFWSVLAKNLCDLRSAVMGYDIINEPYTIEDTDCDYFDDMPMAHTDILQHFYSRVVEEIRKIDSDVGIILKGQWFSSPRAFAAMQPINDRNVYYGFHAYIPPLLTLSRILDPNCSSSGYKYPGFVKKWVNESDEKILINHETLRKLLMDTVHCWQEKYNVPSRQILVAEFGICREVEGAMLYLSDLIKIFNEFQWNWLVFSFRDEEWDALDYELGVDMGNMLHRLPTELFMTVSKHFH